ncbi:zinc-binding alcohol dehydrogenase domain-containing protein cipB [Apiospora sp. TS-2023a]
MAVASGYEVIATASPKNFDYWQEAGREPGIITKPDLLGATEGKKMAGSFAIMPGSVDPCIEGVHKNHGSKKLVASAVGPFQGTATEGVEVKSIFASTLRENEVGPIIFEKYLPDALSQGKHECAPKPRVAGSGLESITQWMT